MRIARTAVFFLVVIALAFLLARMRRSATRPPAITRQGSNRLESSGAVNETNETHGGRDTEPEERSSAPASRAPALPKEIRARAELAAENDVPITFYGRLEDQNSNAVVGADINFSVRVYNGNESKVDRGHVTSDARGRFVISGYRGESLSVVPQKRGYAMASLNGGGAYSRLYPENQRVHSDMDNPVVMKMWKLSGSEPLLAIDKRYKLPPPTEPVTFDVVRREIVQGGGDLKITIARPQGILSQTSKQDWSATIEAVDGGVIEAEGTERVTYFAPADGYLPSVSISMRATNQWPNNWFDNFREGLYVKSRNGQVYSKLTVSLRINKDPRDPIYIGFSGIANTNGSRNWEDDPNTAKVVGQ